MENVKWKMENPVADKSFQFYMSLRTSPQTVEKTACRGRRPRRPIRLMFRIRRKLRSIERFYRRGVEGAAPYNSIFGLIRHTEPNPCSPTVPSWKSSSHPSLRPVANATGKWKMDNVKCIIKDKNIFHFTFYIEIPLFSDRVSTRPGWNIHKSFI